MTRQQEGDEAIVRFAYMPIGATFRRAKSRSANFVKVSEDHATCRGRKHVFWLGTPCRVMKSYFPTPEEITPPVQPEDETTLPVLGIDIKDYNRSNGHVEFRQEELEIRERQLKQAIADCVTAKELCDRAVELGLELGRREAEAIKRAEVAEAERDALKAERGELRLAGKASACECSAEESCSYLKRAEAAESELSTLKARLDAVVGQETPQQAFERGQRVMRDYLATQFDSQIAFASLSGSLRNCFELPYTPPLKAGK